MIATSKITTKGQITIPKNIRDELDLHEGNIIAFEKKDDDIIIRKTETIEDYEGFLKNKDSIKDFDEIRKVVKENISRKRVLSE